MKQPVVFVCPLDWGLGHASRSVPLICDCLEQKYHVVVAASGRPLAFLRIRFGEQVEYLHYPGVQIGYGKGKWALLKLILQAPLFILSIWKEYRWMQKTVKRYSPSLIISDNRYGARSAHCPSILITHQLQIWFPAGFLRASLTRINQWLIKRFDQCWVPDNEKLPALAGELSKGYIRENVHYIGLLSRFEGWKDPLAPWWHKQVSNNFILMLLSGPEPQRTLLEEALKTTLADQSVVGLRGIPEEKEPEILHPHIWLNHANDQTIAWCIQNAGLVICRPGYSSLMDLAFFSKRALVIPTPGQPEQEYLAYWLHKNHWAASLKQDQVDRIGEHIEAAKKTKGLCGLAKPDASSQRKKRIGEILGNLQWQLR